MELSRVIRVIAHENTWNPEVRRDEYAHRAALQALSEIAEQDIQDLEKRVSGSMK